MTKLELAILDNLSDDRECPATICPEVQAQFHDISRQDVLNALCQLFDSGFINLIDGHSLDKDSLMAEPEGSFDTVFWFGLTAAGCLEWETNADPPIDWSDMWRYNIDLQNMVGYIEGVSKDVCMRKLSQHNFHDKLDVDMGTLVHSSIKEFRAKYYKCLPGGHRIDFKMKMRP